MTTFGPIRPEGTRILLADDSLAIALPLIACLKESGYRQITHVGDGQKAVQAFEADPFDLVLMDVVMPVMDGIEATRRIKALSTERWVPVIMITSLGDKRDLVAGLDAGADDYLVKPVDMVELTARINSMSRIVNIQRRLQTILDHAFDGIVSLDGQGVVQSFNRAAEQVFGYSAAEIVGGHFSRLLAGNGSARDDELLRRLSAGGRSKIAGRRKNGDTFLMQFSVNEILRADGSQFIGVVRDISEEEAARRRIEFLAHHDQLTGLPNRAHFSDHLDAACRRAQEQPGALLFIDLDGFKPVNDNYGHDVGDAALRVVAQRLRGAIDDRDFVARLGGDEFVVLLADVGDGKQAAAIAQRLIQSIGQPMQLHGHTCQVGASIGVALIAGPAAAPDRILSAADSGMYAAKHAGKNRVALAPPQDRNA